MMQYTNNCNRAVLIFIALVDYIKHPSTGCYDGTKGTKTALTSKNLNDAKIECSKHPKCHMFVDRCGDASEFFYCTKTGTLQRSGCLSNLYKPGTMSMCQLKNYLFSLSKGWFA